MLSLQNNIVHLIPHDVKTILGIEQEIANFQLALQGDLSKYARKNIGKLIELKQYVLNCARCDVCAVQDMGNLHQQIVVLESSLNELRNVQPVDVDQLTKKTVLLTLLKDSYRECIFWMRKNQPNL